MEALSLRCTLAPLLCALLTATASAATYQTRNFSVTAGSPEVAKQVGDAAEGFRRQLAVYWLGEPLPNWGRACRVRVREGAMLPASGQTTFQFSRGEVYNWDMIVSGSIERILDSVLPHEVNHTIFACHFRRPLPRWADEGAATLFEARSEQLIQINLLNQVIEKSDERFSLRDLLSKKEYPRSHRPMLILYAQGYALADFLVQQKGQATYLKFLAEGETIGWEEAIRRNFDHEGIESLERNWQGWVLAGMPGLTLPRDQMLAATPETRGKASPVTSRVSSSTAVTAAAGPRASFPQSATIRSQSPDPIVPAPAIAASDSVATTPVSTAGHSIRIRSSGQQADAVPRPTSTPQAFQPRRSTIEAVPPRPAPQGSGGSDRTMSSTRDSVSRVSPSVTPSEVTQVAVAGLPWRPDGFQATTFQVDIKDTSKSASAKSAAASLPDSQPDVISSAPPEQQVRDPRSSATRVLPSGERNEELGRTPRWAGFPGQQKLF